jgi:D-alanine-D-alanine ligase
MSKLRVAVLMGGISSEREVSLRSGANVVAALSADRYEVLPVDFTGDLAPLIALKGQVDIVFLALHGPGGEDGKVQALFELLGVPYTGTGVLGSAVAMHKWVAKQLYWQEGIPTPPGILLTSGGCAHAEQVVRERVGIPCVVKPANEGSTIGISVVKRLEDLAPALTGAFTYDADVVVEAFVAGIEISVPVLGTAEPHALPAIEIIPQSGFYDYEMKYQPGATEEICPARISETATARAAAYALQAHRALHCRGVSRTDMMVNGDEVMVLETNTLPGMTDTSLLPLAARTVGMSFADLLTYLIDDALTMHGMERMAGGYNSAD